MASAEVRNSACISTRAKSGFRDDAAVSQHMMEAILLYTTVAIGPIPQDVEKARGECLARSPTQR